jgi:hypothetical protein
LNYPAVGGGYQRYPWYPRSGVGFDLFMAGAIMLIAPEPFGSSCKLEPASRTRIVLPH